MLAIVETMTKAREQWIDFIMQFELELENPNQKRTQTSALTIGLSYVEGGFIPLSAYMLFQNLCLALLVSVLVTLLPCSCLKL